MYPPFTVSEGDGDPNAPAIAIPAIVAGLSVIVLVVLVAFAIWRQLRKHTKLVLAKLPTCLLTTHGLCGCRYISGFHFKNREAVHDEVDLTSYRPS